MEKLTYDVRSGEAAERVGCSKRSLLLAVQNGDLPVAIIGRQKLVTETALQEWIEKRTQKPTPERRRAVRALAKGALVARAAKQAKRGAK